MNLVEPTFYSLAILRGLQYKPVYMGTVTYAERLRRRAKNKMARISRRKNRT